MKSTEELLRLRDELKAKGVKYCVGAYVDIHGVPKGKFVPIDHFVHFAEGSELYYGQKRGGAIKSTDEVDRALRLVRGVVKKDKK